jgi:hypothetical protein
MKMRRWSFTILLFLFLGAIANVAIAWGFAARLPCYVLNGESRRAYMRVGETTLWCVSVHRSVGRELVSSACYVNHPHAEQLERLIVEAGPSFPAEVLPSWTRLEKRHYFLLTAPPDTELELDQWDSAFGVPFLTLTTGKDLLIEMKEGQPPKASMGITSGLKIAEPAVGDLDGNWLPLRPLSAGLIANTVFYAAIFWLVICGPFALRRLIRLRRGWCPKCGYDLRHTLSAGCPECGWGREPKEAA